MPWLLQRDWAEQKLLDFSRSFCLSTHAMRGIEEGCATIEKLNEKLINNAFNMDDLAHDRFGILLVVKMPDYAQQNISFGLPLSSANLFRHIFAALDYNAKLLENRVENISTM